MNGYSCGVTCQGSEDYAYTGQGSDDYTSQGSQDYSYTSDNMQTLFSVQLSIHDFQTLALHLGNFVSVLLKVKWAVLWWSWRL
jgi:hypothetical protein